MPALPMKSEYGPTLGQLLGPRWRAAAPRVRAAIVALAVAAAATIAGAVLTLENARYSHAGRVAFSFSYRDLWRTAPEPGGFIRIVSRHPEGALRESLAVAPLALPPYAGELSGELPLYASGYIRSLRRRFKGFVLRGEGKAKINGMVSAYNVFFTALVQGREMYGRAVLLLPEGKGAREGVTIVMLITPGKGAGDDTPIEVGTAGPLFRPLKSFSFG
jgi:hypothetical protein